MDEGMQPIHIYKNKSDLRGTVYFELLPGPYRGQCWNEGSLFFDEETFGYFEPIIERHAPDFDHYAFTEIPTSSWSTIADDLKELQNLLLNAQSIDQLEGHLGFIFGNTKRHFAENFLANKSALADVIEELLTWVIDKANKHGSITVLGL
jgi:hypothetical protein